MTIGGWILFIIVAVFIGSLGLFFTVEATTGSSKALAVLFSIILIVALLLGMFWYFNNTASGQRALTDQKSELANGLERTINVYTANGDLIATYNGKIDIDTNDGGYVKFDFEGKRYVYCNCFVETIAEIN